MPFQELTPNAIEKASRWLTEIEPRFEQVFVKRGPVTWTQKPDGFEGLLQSIVSQQLSTQAARTIWHRLCEAQLTTAHAINMSSDEALKATGLSHQKIRYSRALAAADLDFTKLRRLDTVSVCNELLPIAGIGPWTAKMYALFSLGHSDVFAPEDLGLQEGLRKLFKLNNRPTPSEASAFAKPWSPWRSVASLALWAWHDHIP